MPVADFFIRQGDERPPLEAVFLNKNSQPVSLAGFASFRFVMEKPDGSGHREGPAVVVDAAAGRVRYDWQAGDTDIDGVFRVVWIGTDADGKDQTFPTSGYNVIQIEPAL